MIVILIFLFLFFIIYSVNGGALSGIEHITLMAGFFIVVSFFVGKFLKKLGLPLITGYLLSGIFFSPTLTGLIDKEILNYFKYINEIALSFIAFAAGVELNIKSIKRNLKNIWIITVFQVFIAFLLVFMMFLIFFHLSGILSNFTNEIVISLAVLIGVVSTAKSPATTIAVIIEEKAKGEMTDIVLGVTIIKDVLIMFFFSIALSFTTSYSLKSSDEKIWNMLFHLTADIVLSLIVGIFFALIIYFYIKVVNRYLLLFLFSLTLILAGLYYSFELHFLLTCIMAGFVLRNYTDVGDIFYSAIEKVSLPVIIMFFSISGASFEAGIFKKFWFLALFYVIVRALFTFLGTYIGAMVSKASENIKKYSWFGFLGQAGVSIGFAYLIGKEFGEPGILIKNIILTGIIINQVVGPIGFSWALRKSGESRAN